MSKKIIWLAALAAFAVFALPVQAAPAGFVRVEGGAFQRHDRRDVWPGVIKPDVIPAHTVAVSAFYMAARQVTQGEWLEIMGTTVSQQRYKGIRDMGGGGWDPGLAGEGSNRPMYNVNWFEAAEFANRMSERSGLAPAYEIIGTGSDRAVKWNRGANGYRLPTEAEWEFAARGGDGSPGDFEFAGSNVAGEVAWYARNSGRSAQDVGTLMPNALGLYDMSGNVWEWVWDWHGPFPHPGAALADPAGAPSGIFRVLRGGAWHTSSAATGSAFRHWNRPMFRDRGVGFRLARSLGESAGGAD